MGRAVLVGHDLGGGVAQIAAVRAPGRCAGLVLANSIGYDSWPIPSVRGRTSQQAARHDPGKCQSSADANASRNNRDRIWIGAGVRRRRASGTAPTPA
jgi:pimeloyl-ACP methyl ester carboxylesterase